MLAHCVVDMRLSTLVSFAIFGLASASAPARRQEFDIDAYESAAAQATTAAPPIGDAAPQGTGAYDPTSLQEKVVAQITSAAPGDATQAAVSAPQR
ncbi:hypothetical protein GQ53DRAFT_845869 [Thozetella sp. PMI_491]|nr:hypothetical protein GQ53DRAFT_845869 [Thozetella sp. PMI_491]